MEYKAGKGTVDPRTARGLEEGTQTPKLNWSTRHSKEMGLADGHNLVFVGRTDDQPQVAALGTKKVAAVLPLAAS